MGRTTPTRYCARPGCGELVRAGYCVKHGGTGTFSRPWERPSDPDRTRLRGRAWMSLRELVLAEEYLCYVCRGLGLADDEIDHVDGDKTHNDRENLRRIHRDCHLHKSAADRRRAHG